MGEELFTGIVEETGTIRSLRRESKGAAIVISAQSIPPTLKIGDSVAVNGVCLTVIRVATDSFACDVSSETLGRSSIGEASPGKIVNLERPLLVGARLGGHFVQGHVDGVGRLLSSKASGEGSLMTFSFPRELEKYLVYKGSVAVDGISLTVASVGKDSFEVAVIPHTLHATNLKQLRVGDPVNLEADILAKYFERYFTLGLNQAPGAGLTVDYLKEQGF